MRLELPVRLAFPLYFCVMMIFFSGIDSLIETLGFWNYIIEVITLLIIMWLLQKSKLTEKEVPIWVGFFIIIAGFTIGIIFNTLVVNHI